MTHWIHRSALAALFVILALCSHAVNVSLSPSPARCGLNNGYIIASPSGGVPPYSYSWSNGSTFQNIGGLAPGDYTVTLTDGLGNTAQNTATVTAVWDMGTINLQVLQPDCNGACTAMALVDENAFQGAAPYDYQIQPSNVNGDLVYDYLCAGPIPPPTQFPFSDANGCPGMMQVDLTFHQVQTGGAEVLNITPACEGETNGSITVRLMNGDPEAYLFVGNGMGFYETYQLAQGEVFTVTGLGAGSYGVSAWINGYDGNPMCTTPNPQIVPSIPGPCGTVSGTVFNDSNADCTQDTEEPGLPYRVLTVQPGPIYAFTNTQGEYTLGIPFGNYTLAQPLIDEEQLCPGTTPVPFTLDNATPQVTVDLADNSLIPHDLDVHLTCSALRPGFPFSVWGTVRNQTAFASGTVTIQLTYPGLLDPAVASGTGTASAGIATWSLPIVSAFDNSYFSLHGTVPPDLSLLGQALSFTATVSNTLGEADLANNSTTRTRTVTGSYDPNEKLGVTSSQLSPTQFFADLDDWLDYTIHFQNTGTDTAFTVVVRDTLDPDLDISTLEFLGASHAFEPSVEEGRALAFTFADVLLPDSTTDLAGSQGYISYRIKPRSGLVAGNVISNTAGIYFDFNPPIITNTVSHVVDFATSAACHVAIDRVIDIWPNPASAVLNVELAEPNDRLIGVFDTRGTLIPLPMEQLDGRVVIHINALPTGIYAVRSTSGMARLVKM